jgi:hypothetical protein
MFQIGDTLQYYDDLGIVHTAIVLDVCFDYQTDSILEGYFVSNFGYGMLPLSRILIEEGNS